MRSAQVAAHCEQARETERAAIARRVHDELGQGITALQMDLASIQNDLAALPPAMGAAISGKVSEMSDTVGALLHTVRQVACELRPPILDQFGIAAAIPWQAHEFGKKFGLQCQVRGEWQAVFEDSRVETAIFRIFQETLTNVARHAGATRVRISMREKPSALVLTIEDDGRGFSEEGRPPSLGLLGMCERARLFKGEVRIAGRLGQGTRVALLVPSSAVRGKECEQAASSADGTAMNRPGEPASTTSAAPTAAARMNNAKRRTR